MSAPHQDAHSVDTHHNGQSIDLEKGGAGMQGGAGIQRQISVQLTPEQFEQLYLQPGGTAAKGDLAKRFANPTPLGIVSFLLALTPFSCLLMGWQGATSAGALTQVGGYYFIAGLGLTIAGILEWILGNTFPFIVFTSFGGFWLAFGFLLDPSKGVADALGGNTTPEYAKGLAIYLLWWAIVVFIYLLASLRTNMVFVLLFFFLEITFDLLIATYFRIGRGNVAHLESYLKASGAFGFLTTICGWYLLAVLVFGSTGLPIALPVGDLSGFMSGKRKQT